MIKCIHVALECSSEEKSDIFYREILGLKKIKSALIPASLISKISSYNSGTLAVVYGNGNFTAEVFIARSGKKEKRGLSHTCIEVYEMEKFVERCRRFDIEPIEIEKGDRIITFVSDFDGNLFEIKERAG